MTSSDPAADGRRRADEFLTLLAAEDSAADTLLEGLTELRDLAFLGAGLTDFRRVVVGIGADLEASILTTALVAEMGIPGIWAKVMSAQHATILGRIDAHHVVFPEHESGERVAHLVSGRLLDWVELDPQWVFAKTKPPRELVGIPLGESGLRKRHRVTVVSVQPENAGTYTHAGMDTVLTYGATIVIAGRPADVERFVERK